MKTRAGFQSRKQSQAEYAFALVMVMVLTACMMLVLSGAMSWTTNTANLTQRNNQFYTSQYAAEAASEKIITQMTSDFMQNNSAAVLAKLSTYRTNYPLSSENTFWTNYIFSDATGATNTVTVTNTSTAQVTTLNTKYAGLYGLADNYSVIVNARQKSSMYDITAAVEQDIQLATIPIFQYAIFFGVLGELSNGGGTTFNIYGKVHCNNTLYVCPDGTQNYYDVVTAVGSIVTNLRAPGNNLGNTSAPNYTAGIVNFLTNHYSGVPSLNLPIGTNNASTNCIQIINAPPTGEDTNSLMSQQRLYNKADLILTVTNATYTNWYQSNYAGALIKFTNSFVWTNSTNAGLITTNTAILTNIINDGIFVSYTTNFYSYAVRCSSNRSTHALSGTVSNSTTWSGYVTNPVSFIDYTNSIITGATGPNKPSATLSASDISKFVNTQSSFDDQRESKQVMPINVDIGKLKTWDTSNTVLNGSSGALHSTATAGNVEIVYVDDERQQASGNVGAVRLTNGLYLPTKGLTLATADPVYIQGNYNIGTNDASYTNVGVNITNTSMSSPASIAADCINILSTAWSDSANAAANGGNAGHTVINAALLGGNVATLTALTEYGGGAENYPRYHENWQPAAGKQTCTINGSMVILWNSVKETAFPGAYTPPNRNYSFDNNFLNSAKLPPGTPSVQSLIRASWETVAAKRSN